MMFQIGNKVIVKNTTNTGVITDKMYSESTGSYVYAVNLDGEGESVLKKASDLDLFVQAPEYEVQTEIADNVVIGVIYEVVNGKRREVCRGHAHIIHGGAEGVAQACSYAFKRAFAKIDTGIYYKQRKCQ